MHKRAIASLSIVVLLVLSSVLVWASHPLLSRNVALAQPVEQNPLDKVESRVLQELSLDGQTEFFVWMTEKADLSPAYQLPTKLEKGRFVYETLRATAERTQAPLRAFLDRRGIDYRPFYVANKILIWGGNEALLDVIAARADVAEITANHQYQLDEPVEKNDNPPHILSIEPNITFINADDVWALGYDGQGTVMAGNDTGLDETHPAIARHYRGCLNPPTCSSWDHNYNWWDATGTYPTNPGDGHGHGTHTTGTMVGDDGGSNQIGVAPGAQTVHCKNMTNSGSGSDATFTECFEWDLAPWDLNGQNADPDKAPDAINNSWGYSGGNQNQFRDEVQALHAAGILVEVSAGNEGSSCATLRSPGDYWESLTTGSVNHASSFPGTITGFSSRGPSDLDGNYFPDVMAPGENIRSSLPGNSYSSWNGTSMAGPHTTALVGLIWSACSSYQGDVYGTIDLITDNAVPLSGQTGSNCGGDYTNGPNNDWGYGTIDALAAVEACLGGPPPTPTPEPPTPTPTTEPPTPTPPPGQIFFDDFETSQGWTTDPSGTDTASTGMWERANPEETSYSGRIYQQGSTVSGVYDLVTEGSAGSSVGSYDIDNGVTSIRSPDIVLPNESGIELSFSYYLAHYSNATADDYLRVKVVGSTTTTVFEELGSGDYDEAVWDSYSTSLDAYAGQTIYLLIEAADGGGGSLVEAAIDDVSITSSGGPPPTPTSEPPTPTPEPPTPTPPPGPIFFDDFETSQGWITDPSGTDTATTGMWERANPESTSYGGRTYQQGTTVSGSYDLVTEGSAGSSVGSYDIDNGVTSIRSPDITLPSGSGITLSFYYYLAHYSNATADDYLRVKVVGSTTTTVFEELGSGDYDEAVWDSYSTSLDAYAGQTIYLLIEAADAGGASLVEAAIDDVSITSN